MRDSLEVRKELILRVKAGEISLEDAQKQIRRLKREAKSAGEESYHQMRRRTRK